MFTVTELNVFLLTLISGDAAGGLVVGIAWNSILPYKVPITLLRYDRRVHKEGESAQCDVIVQDPFSVS